MPLRDAVNAYFTGERFEMIAILIGACVTSFASVVLWLRMRDGFATGLAITVLASGALLGATAVTLLVRDGRDGPALAQAMSTPDTAGSAIVREAARIDAVIRNYPTYRYVAAGLLALAFAGLLLTARGWVHGAAVGLMLVAVAQVVIDHYSEQRARQYSTRLAGRLS